MGLSGMKVKDALVMPNRYTGTNLQFGFSYVKRKPKSIQEIYLDGVVGGIKTRDANPGNNGGRYREPRSALYWTDMGYLWIHDVPALSFGKYRTYMGASAWLMINARFNERWDNSAINYEGAFTPLSWQMHVERDLFTKQKILTLSYRLNLPLLTYVMRPEFAGVPDFLDHEADFLSSLISTPASKWTGFWKFPRIKSEIDLQMPIRGNNVIQFSYKWEYYSYEAPVKTQFASHSFLFTFLAGI
jgi:hypothetical protein